MPTRIYLDANAGAPLLAKARVAMMQALAQCANASSVHAEGRRARMIVETARAEVAAAVGAEPDNVIFTSGATEAAQLALTPEILVGAERRCAARLYVGATEHPCVLAGGRFAPEAVAQLPVHSSGVIDLAALEDAMRAHDPAVGPPFVALMLANNETGVVHPIAAAARIVKAHGGYLFCDAAQAVGRIPVDVKALGADFLALSAHKIGGPQGAGALVLADEAVRPEPLLRGGGQERNRRAGTENVAALAGFGVAARLSDTHLRDAQRLAALRERLERGVFAVSPEVFIAGAGVDRLPNTSLFAGAAIPSEIAVIAFDLVGLAVSAGSACSSGKVAASHVLRAMGASPEAARSGVRVSLGVDSEPAHVEAFIAAWRDIHGRIGQRSAA